MNVEEQLRNLGRETEARQVPVSVDEVVTDGSLVTGDVPADPVGGSRPSWLAMAAATVLVIVGVGALVWWADDDPAPVVPADTGVPGTSSPPSTISGTVAPVEMTPTLDRRPDGEWFIPGVIPDGFEFGYAVRQDVSGVADGQFIVYERADCGLSGGCAELRVSLLTDIDAASLGGPESSWQEVAGAEDVFAASSLGSGEVIRRDGEAVTGIGGGNLSFEDLVEVARSTRLRPESELPRPPFICCTAFVEEEGNPGPVVAEFSLDTDDGEETWTMTAHTDGRYIALGGYGIGEDTFGPAHATPIDPPATVSTRPGRLVGSALPAGYDLVVGITRRDVDTVEIVLDDDRVVTIRTSDLSGRFDARFVFAAVDVDAATQSSSPSAIGIQRVTALDADGQIVESP